MRRLLFWAVLFAAGVWTGMGWERALAADRCLDAGGRIAAPGLCEGTRP
jgi:hypothetical protein